MDDDRIVRLFWERDEQAIEETAAKYGALCHRIAYNVLSDRQDAEECVSDTYVGLWNAIPPATPHNFKAFVCKVARNVSLKRLAFLTREKRSPEGRLSLDELAGVLSDERCAPDVSDEEVGRHISAFLREQSPDAQRVFIRRYVFFDSVSAIAVRYGFTESKVKNLLFRTRNKLRNHLIKEGVAL